MPLPARSERADKAHRDRFGSCSFRRYAPVCIWRSPRYQRVPVARGCVVKARIFCSRVKAYIRLVVGNHLRAHVRNRDDQPPFSGRDCSREIRRRGIRFADGEMAFVSAALTTKTLWIGDAEVQGSALIFPGVMKVNTDTVYAGRHCERDLEVGLVLRAFYVAREYQVCGHVITGMLSHRPRCERKSQKNEGHTPSLHEVQNNSNPSRKL